MRPPQEHVGTPAEFLDCLHAVEFAAPLAVIAQGAAVELKDLLAAGNLMESVDVLRDDSLQLARALPPASLRCAAFGFASGQRSFAR